MNFVLGIVVGFAVGWVVTHWEQTKAQFNRAREWVAHKTGQ